jgi:hypothetical protein
MSHDPVTLASAVGLPALSWRRRRGPAECDGGRGQRRVPRLITFLSDFGLADSYAGVCRVVIAGLAPGAPVVDLLHTIPALDVRRGATVLADCVRVAPPAVHLAVVDPDQSAPGVAVVAGAAVLVGPDNGLLPPAADALGGVTSAVRLDDPRAHRTPVSPVFRARDVFAPVAARIATGVDPATLGTPIPPAALCRLPLRAATVEHRRIAAEVRNIDCYGNVQLPVTQDHLARAGLDGGRPVLVGTRRRTVEVRRVASFSELTAGELGLLEDSSGWLAIVAGGDHAARSLGVEPADDIRLGDG